MLSNKFHALLKSGWIFSVLFFLFCTSISAHEKDTLTPHKDSLRIYKKIKKIAYKHKLTTWAFDLVFVDPEPKEYPTQPASKEEKIVNPYLKYQGAIIRNIYITVYDPFGHNVADTIMQTINTLQRLGNRAHTTTRRWVINNKLLFKKNDSINALSLSETERELREAIYVNDARIYISGTKSKDSADVHVIVHDKWPITVPILITDVFANAKFRNYNLFGVGQQFEQFAEVRRPDLLFFNGFYNIANIDNTYISSRLAYQTDKNQTGVNVSFDRPFFSPLAKWAGGVSLYHTWKKYNYTDTIIGESKRIPLNNLGYDVWGGKSLKISKDNSFFNQSTNVIVAGRYFSNTYLNRPSHAIDTAKSYYSTTALLGNIGFSIQQYYKDKYIYRFGANEDVPEGLIVQFIYGGLKQEFKKLRYYTAIEVARAKHLSFGYLSSTFSYGVLFNKLVANDITINYKLSYFSNLVKKGDWFLRQFIDYNLVHGENKLAGETITLSSDDLYGFDSKALSGNTKMVLNSQTVAYLPYQIIGFRLAPVIAIGLGMLGDHNQKVLKSNLYQAYTLGLMIRNENLLVSTFQFSVGFYPLIPNGGSSVIKYNPIGSFTLKVRAFAVSRPDFISYY